MAEIVRVVFDTSVIMALLWGEPVANPKLPDVRWATMSAVNVAEVCTLLADADDTGRSSGFRMLGFLRSIEPFTDAQARLAGEFRRLGKNISLGNRACLALAVDIGAEIYTADRAWLGLDVGVPIHLIR